MCGQLQFLFYNLIEQKLQSFRRRRRARRIVDDSRVYGGACNTRRHDIIVVVGLLEMKIWQLQVVMELCEKSLLAMRISVREKKRGEGEMKNEKDRILVSAQSRRDLE